MDFREKAKKIEESAFDYESALIRTNRSQSEVDELRKALSNLNQSLLSDYQLLIFLSHDNTIEQAAEKLKMTLELKSSTPAVFLDRDPYSQQIIDACDNLNIFYLPVPPSGHSVIYSSLRNFSVYSFDFEAAMKLFFMTSEACLLKQGPQNGFIFLIDLKGSSVFHLSKLTLSIIKMGFKFANNPPQKIHAFHVFNCASFFKIFLRISKPFARRELKSVLHLHYHDIDWKEFYEQHLPQECLPANYGGFLPSIDQMRQNNLLELQSLKEYFKIDEEIVKNYKKVI